jgi:hypothetical protein
MVRMWDPISNRYWFKGLGTLGFVTFSVIIWNFECIANHISMTCQNTSQNFPERHLAEQDWMELAPGTHHTERWSIFVLDSFLPLSPWLPLANRTEFHFPVANLNLSELISEHFSHREGHHMWVTFCPNFSSVWAPSSWQQWNLTDFLNAKS